MLIGCHLRPPSDASKNPKKRPRMPLGCHLKQRKIANSRAKKAWKTSGAFGAQNRNVSSPF
jgi:hypothetical protein